MAAWTAKGIRNAKSFIVTNLSEVTKWSKQDLGYHLKGSCLPIEPSKERSVFWPGRRVALFIISLLKRGSVGCVRSMAST